MKSILLTAICFCAFEDMGETVDYKKTVSILTRHAFISNNTSNNINSQLVFNFPRMLKLEVLSFIPRLWDSVTE